MYSDHPETSPRSDMLHSIGVTLAPPGFQGDLFTTGSAASSAVCEQGAFEHDFRD